MYVAEMWEEGEFCIDYVNHWYVNMKSELKSKLKDHLSKNFEHL